MGQNVVVYLAACAQSTPSLSGARAAQIAFAACCLEPQARHGCGNISPLPERS